MLAERWNGSSWSVQRTPNPAGATYGQFAGVSCPSQRFCTAVGFLTNGADIEVTLAQRRHGTRWSIQQTPNPGGARSSGLNGVSCPSLRSCAAVGFFTDRAGTLATLAERWNGNSWAIQRTPNPIGGALVGVSCASRMACTALGSNCRGNASRALERDKLVDPADPQPGRRDQQPARRGVVRFAQVLHRRRVLHQPHRHHHDAGGAIPIVAWNIDT